MDFCTGCYVSSVSFNNTPANTDVIVEGSDVMKETCNAKILKIIDNLMTQSKTIHEFFMIEYGRSVVQSTFTIMRVKCLLL